MVLNSKDTFQFTILKTFKMTAEMFRFVGNLINNVSRVFRNAGRNCFTSFGVKTKYIFKN